MRLGAKAVYCMFTVVWEYGIVTNGHAGYVYSVRKYVEEQIAVSFAISILGMSKLYRVHIPCDWATRKALLIPVRAAARAGVVKRIVNDRFDGLLPFDEWRADSELTSVTDGLQYISRTIVHSEQ